MHKIHFAFEMLQKFIEHLNEGDSEFTHCSNYSAPEPYRPRSVPLEQQFECSNSAVSIYEDPREDDDSNVPTKEEVPRQS